LAKTASNLLLRSGKAKNVFDLLKWTFSTRTLEVSEHSAHVTSSWQIPGSLNATQAFDHADE
jgi:hypothetical protein